MELHRLLGRQDGVISRGQALAAGLSSRAIEGKLTRGDWIAVVPGVYRTADRQLTTRSRIRVAMSAVGRSAVLGGWAAAWWWGLTDAAPPTIEIDVPPGTVRQAPPGTVVLRRLVEQVDISSRDGVRLMARPLAALRAAVEMEAAGAAFLDRQLQTGLRFDQLHAAYCRQLGWRGSPRAHELMAAASDAAASRSERVCVGLLKEAGIRGWRMNAEVTIGGECYRPDLSFLRERVAIEVDGWAWHHQPDRFRRDRVRQNRFLLSGWLVLRFTWYDLHDRPRAVVAEIRAALAGRA